MTGRTRPSSRGEPDGEGSFSQEVSALPRGADLYVRAYATNPLGTAYGAQVEFFTAPAAPENVNATDGEFEDYVLVTWDASPGAGEYDVYRGGELIATTESLRFEDTTVGGSPPPAPPANVQAEGSLTSVTLTWDPSLVAASELATYTVRARSGTATARTPTPTAASARPRRSPATRSSSRAAGRARVRR